MVKILFYGTKNAAYHPAAPFAARMRQLLKELYASELDFSLVTEEAQLCLSGESAPDLLILYPDFLSAPLSARSQKELLRYVSNGHPALVIHSGISCAEQTALLPLTGAAFAGHPDYTHLPLVRFVPEETPHPITAGIPPFNIPDEYYRFDFSDPLPAHFTPFMTYREVPGCDGVTADTLNRSWMAGWTHTFGAGTVAYLCCGHSSDAFDSPEVRALYRNAVLYLMSAI